MHPPDEVDFLAFVHAARAGGVHLLAAAGPDGIAAAAVLGRALTRARVPLAGLTVLGYGERPDSPTARDWVGDARAVVAVGLHAARIAPAVPQFTVDGGPSGDRGAPFEPVAARAFRLAGALTHAADAVWLAALGLLDGPEHALVERALARHRRDELDDVAALLDAAARGPEPAGTSLIALDLLIAAPDAHRFLHSEAMPLLRRTQAMVQAELARATRVRPRAGYGVVVVEYESPCRLEDLVAARWRGLRPGTAVLVANHGAVEGQVAVTARAAVPEALDRLRATLSDEGTTLIDPVTWSHLLVRLGVAPAPVEHISDGTPALGTLPN